jgi:hypothetical protein
LYRMGRGTKGRGGERVRRRRPPRRHLPGVLTVSGGRSGDGEEQAGAKGGGVGGARCFA